MGWGGGGRLRRSRHPPSHCVRFPPEIRDCTRRGSPWQKLCPRVAEVVPESRRQPVLTRSRAAQRAATARRRSPPPTVAPARRPAVLTLFALERAAARRRGPQGQGDPLDRMVRDRARARHPLHSRQPTSQCWPGVAARWAARRGGRVPHPVLIGHAASQVRGGAHAAGRLPRRRGGVRRGVPGAGAPPAAAPREISHSRRTSEGVSD